MSSSSLSDRLWETARDEADRLGTELNPTAETQLKRFIDQGVMEMKSLGVENDPSRIQEAENNIVQFVRAMNKHAQRRDQDKLDRSSFAMAKIICPLWPFC
jgi:ferredoxin-thioredoxin reductase catalytic subunit